MAPASTRVRPRSTTSRTVDLVVEAIAEDLAIKTPRSSTEPGPRSASPGAILATTTSSPAGDRLARRPPRGPQDVIGMHFFNPAPVMKLVEVVSTVVHLRGRHRDHPGAVRRRSASVAVSCGDRAGFIVNALLFPYLNDAVRMLEAPLRDRPTTSTRR
ncbi:MAG: 3-hydroxyacyl-CoA dehydrogenase NAD-binding domain-containing protein [Nocardioides sp.]